ncbi:MAG: sigma-70 family RNA polymerase sigma factor [Sphingomonadales bacterium]
MGKKEQDAALLKQVAAGDMSACRTLVDEHLKKMLGLAYQMLRDVTEAEDVAQDAFLKLWKQAPTWRPDAQIKVWLYRVVFNLCIDRLRKNKNLMDIEPPEEFIEAGQIKGLHKNEIRERLNAAIFDLPERQRTAITLVHLQEEKQKDAAAVMGVSVDALESLLARGKRNLRGKLGKHKTDLMGE